MDKKSIIELSTGTTECSIAAVFNWGDMSPSEDISNFGGDITLSAVMKTIKNNNKKNPFFPFP